MVELLNALELGFFGSIGDEAVTRCKETPHALALLDEKRRAAHLK